MSRIALLSFALTVAACGSQVDSNHQGTPLAKIGGSVRNTRTLPVDQGSEVVVVWQKSSGTPDLTGADSVEVEGSFPAQFKLSIYQPPEDVLLNDWNGTKVGVAYIIAGVPGTDYSNDDGAGILGIEDSHLLVYLPAAITPGSDVSYLLHGAPAAGFHLYGVHKLTEAEKDARQQCVAGLSDASIANIYTICGGPAPFDDFVPLGTDLDTPLNINLVDDIGSVDVPNWT